MFLAIAARTGRTRSSVARSPPIIIVSVPASAPIVPPERGASIISAPCAAASAMCSCEAAGSIVDVSTIAFPRTAAVRTPSSRVRISRTSTCVGKHNKITSALSAASRGVAATRAPSEASACAFEAVRFHRVRGKPAFSRLRDMGKPIAPRPKKATCVGCLIRSLMSPTTPAPRAVLVRPARRPAHHGARSSANNFRSAQPAQPYASIGVPVEHRFPLRAREALFGLDRVEILTFPGAVTLTDQDPADEPALVEIERTIPLLLLVDTLNHLEIVAILGRDAELRDRLVAEDLARVLGDVVIALVAPRHVDCGDFPVRAGVVPGPHAVVQFGDRIVEVSVATRREDALDARLQAIIAANPAGGDLEAAFRDDFRHHAVRTDILLHFLVEVQMHAVLARRLVQKLGGLRGQHS